MVKKDELEGLTEDERKALRGSKFAPLPPPANPSTSGSGRTQPRLAHPGGPLATNKAAALAKFLERKLQEPGGLDSINPALRERAVKNAKETVNASGKSSSRIVVRHVAAFSDSEDSGEEDKDKAEKVKKHKKKKKKNKRKKVLDCPDNGKRKKLKKKLNS